jgi:hypothetical protein
MENQGVRSRPRMAVADRIAITATCDHIAGEANVLPGFPLTETERRKGFMSLCPALCLYWLMPGALKNL